MKIKPDLTDKDRQAVLFIAKFFGAAAVLLPIWLYAGLHYQSVVLALSKPFVLLMGYSSQQISALNLSNTHLYNFNLVSFLSLTIATPLVLKKRLKMLVAGLALMMMVHVLDLVAHFPAYYNNQLALFVLDAIGVIGLVVPLAVWFFFSYKEVPFLRF